MNPVVEGICFELPLSEGAVETGAERRGCRGRTPPQPRMEDDLASRRSFDLVPGANLGATPLGIRCSQLFIDDAAVKRILGVRRARRNAEHALAMCLVFGEQELVQRR